MDKIKPGYLYISADGDGIGKLVGRAVLANDVEELHKVSGRIDAAQDFIEHWCESIDGTKISGGGDEFTAAIPPEEKEKIKSLRESVEKSFGYTISVGVGRNLSEAGTALLVAKLRGKDRIIYFNKHIKDDIKKAKRRVREGRASQEEYKLSDAYLEKSENMLCDLHKNKTCDLHKSEGMHAPHSENDVSDSCPYCADSEDSRTDDCQYCADLDAEENANGTAGMDGCPACKEYDQEQKNTGGIDDCPYCQSENISEIQANPEEDHSALAVQDMGAESPDNCPECNEMYSSAIENQPGQTGQEDPNLQGHETAEEVLDMLDQEPGSGNETPEQAAKQIDNTELPQGSQMRENVSVKDNFGDAQKNDIPDTDMASGQQDSPDMTDVLKDGLDEHANDVQKQKVLDMVGQTLQGFKANKASLEATKEQNQPLYNSCIQMLKSMIELCKLLGLQPQMSSGQESGQSVQNQPPSSESSAQSGQTTPPKAAPAEGAAQDPKARG